jgi:hypothetical protein
MKRLAMVLLLLFVVVAAGCSRGPSTAEVETAYREAIARNDIMGLFSNAVQIEKFQVDKLEEKENGVYEATVTIVSAAHVGPLSVGGAKQTTLRLKKVGEQWVVLQ